MLRKTYHYYSRLAENVQGIVQQLKKPIRWMFSETYEQSVQQWCHSEAARLSVAREVDAYKQAPWYQRAWHWFWNINAIRSKQDAWHCWKILSTLQPLIDWDNVNKFQINATFFPASNVNRPIRVSVEKIVNGLGLVEIQKIPIHIPLARGLQQLIKQLYGRLTAWSQARNKGGMIVQNNPLSPSVTHEISDYKKYVDEWKERYQRCHAFVEHFKSNVNYSSPAIVPRLVHGIQDAEVQVTGSSGQAAGRRVEKEQVVTSNVSLEKDGALLPVKITMRVERKDRVVHVRQDEEEEKTFEPLIAEKPSMLIRSEKCALRDSRFAHQDEQAYHHNPLILKSAPFETVASRDLLRVNEAVNVMRDSKPLSTGLTQMLVDFDKIKAEFMSVLPFLPYKIKVLWEKYQNDFDELEEQTFGLPDDDCSMSGNAVVSASIQTELADLYFYHLLYRLQKELPHKVMTFAKVCGLLGMDNPFGSWHFHLGKVSISDVHREAVQPSRLLPAFSSFPSREMLHECRNKMTYYPHRTKLSSKLEKMELTHNYFDFCKEALSLFPKDDQEWQRQLKGYRFYDKSLLERCYQEAAKIYHQLILPSILQRAEYYHDWRRWWNRGGQILWEQKSMAVVLYQPVERILTQQKINLSATDHREYRETYLYYCGMFNVDPRDPTMLRLNQAFRKLNLVLHPDVWSRGPLREETLQELVRYTREKIQLFRDCVERFSKLLAPHTAEEVEKLKRLIAYAKQEFTGHEPPFHRGSYVSQESITYVSTKIKEDSSVVERKTKQSSNQSCYPYTASLRRELEELKQQMSLYQQERDARLQAFRAEEDARWRRFGAELKAEADARWKRVEAERKAEMGAITRAFEEKFDAFQTTMLNVLQANGINLPMASQPIVSISAVPQTLFAATNVPTVPGLQEDKGWELQLMSPDIKEAINKKQFKPKENVLYVEPAIDCLSYFSSKTEKIEFIQKADLDNYDISKFENIKIIQSKILEITLKRGHTQDRSTLAHVPSSARN